MAVRRAPSFRRAALVSAGAVAVTLSTGLLPAQAATTTGWRAASVIAVSGRATIATSVAATSASDAWAIAMSTETSGTPSTTIRQWTGRSWRTVALPASVARKWNSKGRGGAVIGASSAADVWAFSDSAVHGGEVYLRRHGGHWSAGLIPGTDTGNGPYLTITSVRVFSAANVWVLGGASTATTDLEPFAEHFNGRGWHFTVLPGSGEVTGASAPSAGNIWAVTGVVGNILGLGAPYASSVLHWNGKSWRREPKQPGHLPKAPDLTSIIAGPHGRLTIGGVAGFTTTTVQVFTQAFGGSAWGRPAVLRGWSARPLGPDDVPVIESLVADGHGGLWALGDTLGLAAPHLWHLSHGKVFGPQQPGFGSSRRALLQLASVPRTASVWAAGTVSHGSAQDGLIGVFGRTPR